MTNQVMKQKAMKARRQRRAWAKQYSMPSGIVPNKGVLGDYKERAKGLGVDEYQVDLLIRALYGRDPQVGDKPGKEMEQVLARLKKLLPELHFFQIIDNCYQRGICFFDAKKTTFILAHTDKRRKTYKTSIAYSTKELALAMYYADRVIWMSFEETD